MRLASPLSSASPRVRVAGLWRRAAAGAVDAALLLVVFVLLDLLAAVVLRHPLPKLSQFGPDYLLEIAVNGDALAVTGLVLFAVLCAAYFSLFHSLLGQTVGKRLLGLRVIDGWGNAPSLMRSTGRTLAYAPAALLLGLGFVWIGFDREKRGLHDWLADTYVIVGRPEVSA